MNICFWFIKEIKQRYIMPRDVSECRIGGIIKLKKSQRIIYRKFCILKDIDQPKNMP